MFLNFDDIFSTSMSTSISATRSIEKFDLTRGLMRRIRKERKFNMKIKGICLQSAKIKRRAIFFKKILPVQQYFFEKYCSSFDLRRLEADTLDFHIKFALFVYSAHEATRQVKFFN